MNEGPGEKGAPEIIQKFGLRNWPISSADFPMTPMEGRFPFSRGKNRISQGVENRSSLISAPLALSVNKNPGI